MNKIELTREERGELLKVIKAPQITLKLYCEMWKKFKPFRKIKTDLGKMRLDFDFTPVPLGSPKSLEDTYWNVVRAQKLLENSYREFDEVLDEIFNTEIDQDEDAKLLNEYRKIYPDYYKRLVKAKIIKPVD